MSVTCDANVLLYASDDESPRQQSAQDLLQRLAAGPGIVYLFWPVVMAYLRIGTHPGVFTRPLSPLDARANVTALLAPAHVRAPGEQPAFWDVFEDTCRGDVIRGNLVTDAHLVALMRQHGVARIYTADRDLRRFDGIRVENPFG